MTFLAPQRQIPPFLRYDAELRINLASFMRWCGHPLDADPARPSVSRGWCPFCCPAGRMTVYDREGDHETPELGALDGMTTEARAAALARMPRYVCDRCRAFGGATGFYLRWYNARYEDALAAVCDAAGIPFAGVAT